MMASWHRNAFCIAGPLYRESTEPVIQNFEVFCSQLEQAVLQPVELLVILDDGHVVSL